MGGPVLAFRDLVARMTDAGLSLPGVTRTLRTSPLVVSVARGYWTVLGTTVGPADLAAARARDDAASDAVGVRFEHSGEIVAEMRIDPLTLASGSLLSNRLPRLDGEWDCFVSGRRCGRVAVRHPRIWRLSGPLKEAGACPSSRIRMRFNTNRRHVVIEEISHGT